MQCDHLSEMWRKCSKLRHRLEKSNIATFIIVIKLLDNIEFVLLYKVVLRTVAYIHLYIHTHTHTHDI